MTVDSHKKNSDKIFILINLLIPKTGAFTTLSLLNQKVNKQTAVVKNDEMLGKQNKSQVQFYHNKDLDS